EAAAQRTLDMEVERVRVQADAVLESELARARAEAQNRRAAELQELRNQLAEMREAAAKEARAAAAEAVASEVKRAAANRPAAEGKSYYDIWQKTPVQPQTDQRPAVATQTMFRQPEPEPESEMPWEKWPWLKWAVPAAVVLAFGVYTGIPFKTVGKLMESSPKPAMSTPVEAAPAPVAVVEKKTGDLRIESTPSAAKVSVDGKAYGNTPVTIPDLKPGTHTMVLQSGSGTISRRVTIKAGKTTMASEAIFSGWIAVFSPLHVDVALNGKPASMTDDGRIMAAPGTYKVTFKNDRYNFTSTETLEVKPGEVTAHTVTLPTSTIKVLARDGAEIKVDGEAKGKAPLGELSVAIGTHEVTASGEGGDKRTTIDLKM